MLEGALATSYAPGSNLKADLAGANWWYLLPSLDADRVVCLGEPSRGAISTLARMAGEVVVCTTRPRTPAGPEGIRTVAVPARGPLPLPDAYADVIAVDGRGWLRRIARNRGLADDIARILRPGGSVYLESDRLAGAQGANAVANLLGARTRFWLAPAAGEIRAAVPLGPAAPLEYVERRWIRRAASPRRVLRHPVRVGSRRSEVLRLARRRGVLAGEAADQGVPRYLRALAEANGIAVENRRWALAAPGAYNSQKVLVLLFSQDAAVPEAVVKLTRDPALNGRLENEWRALTLLAEAEIGRDGSLPSPLFLGHHAGLAVVGETAVEGVPFPARTNGRPDCLHAGRAVDWLVKLAAATSGRSLVPPAEAGRTLGTLLDRFAELYSLEPGERSFLADQVARIEAGPEGLPVVFQHGDPGVWNLLVTGAGDVAFLDWEAAEPNGVPLWDLLYLLRSFGVTVSRLDGTSDANTSFARHFLDGSEVGETLAAAVRRTIESTGLAPQHVEPLFYLCWVHRALKEATRLPPGRLERGTFVRLLRLCIERRGSPGLRRLFEVTG